jgi:hypothetical protein
LASELGDQLTLAAVKGDGETLTDGTLGAVVSFAGVGERRTMWL